MLNEVKPNDINNKKIRWISFIVARLSEKSIYVTEQLKTLSRNDYGVVIPCGVDLSVFTPQEMTLAKRKMKLDSTKNYVLFCSKFDNSIKNSPLAIRAFNELKKRQSINMELLELNNFKDAYIRPLVYLGDNMSLTLTNEVHIVMMAWEWGKYLGDSLLRVMLSSFQRPNPKSCFVEAKVVGHYTNSILATTEAKSKGYDEALLTDMNGYVAEGPGANFFIEKEGKLFTAPLGNILAGITRQTVFEIGQELGYEIEEKFFTPEEIFTADSAFFCGTAAEVIGIQSVNDYKFPLEWEDSIGAVIQRKYKRRVAFNEYHNVYL